MFAEQESYREWLLSQPSEEILNHTYEYTVREDILLSMEYNDLPDAQVNALNELRNDLLEEQRSTDIVGEVLLKAIDAPTKKVKCRDEAR